MNKLTRDELNDLTFNIEGYAAIAREQFRKGDTDAMWYFLGQAREKLNEVMGDEQTTD